AGLVATAPSADTRATALLLQAEAAYHAGTYAAASAAFRRALVEFSGHPLAGAARLGVAWAALRQDKDDEARREFLEFVRRDPRDPQAADALLLAAELALKAPTEWTQAKALLDRIVAEYPNRPGRPSRRSRCRRPSARGWARWRRSASPRPSSRGGSPTSPRACSRTRATRARPRSRTPRSTASPRPPSWAAPTRSSGSRPWRS